MKTTLDKFKLRYEYLPSDEQVFESIRRYRARQRKKQKAEAAKIVDWLAASPAFWKKFVAQLRRVKR